MPANPGQQLDLKAIVAADARAAAQVYPANYWLNMMETPAGKEGVRGCRIFYEAVRDHARAEEKRDFLTSRGLAQRPFAEIHPDHNHNWINVTQNDFDLLLPLATKGTKLAKNTSQEKAIFSLFSLGVVTNRDEWVYDDRADSLARKVRFLIESYNAQVAALQGRGNRSKLPAQLGNEIKWTRAVKRDLVRGVRYEFKRNQIVRSLYRPFVKRLLYLSREINEMLYQVPLMFGPGTGANQAISFSSEERVAFGLVALDDVPNKDIFMPSAAQLVARYRFGAEGNRLDNITD